MKIIDVCFSRTYTCPSCVILHLLSNISANISQSDTGEECKGSGTREDLSNQLGRLSIMPPRRRRRSPSGEEVKSKKARTWSSSRRDIKSDCDVIFSSKRCVAWFHEYTGPDEDVIQPEGMEKFCEDIGVEPENIVMLSMAWKLDAKTMGFFSLKEWLHGMSDLQCDSVRKLQSKLDHLKSFLDDDVHFKTIYRYAFDFARDKDQRSMDIDTAKDMLALLLGKPWPLYCHFHQFLEHSKYKVINKDQWCNILEFSRTIKSDLTNYDEDGAWPVLLDEFVDWYREQRKACS